MKKLLIILAFVTIGVLALNALPQNWTQYYFSFQIQDRKELEILTRIISIDNVKENTVTAYANDDEWLAFQALGYKAQILPNPSDNAEVSIARSPEELRPWDSYPTYSAYVAQMNAFATNYPNLCQIVNIGTTPGGRSILFAKISDNVSQHEAEPEICYSSSIHGDETAGYVLMLRLIDYLLTNYNTDPRVQNIVNNLEIWINPLANPDGTYFVSNNTVIGSRRYNLNGVDLNRNFPSADGTQHPDGNAYQPETLAFMNFHNSHNFVLSANFHGGAQVVNYPWDTWPSLHVDNDWFINISQAYVNSVHAVNPNYMTDLNNGITNGYAWYQVLGGRQDWVTYYRHGREVTIELSTTKTLNASQLPTYWNYNYNAFLGYLENALYGIQGIVTNPSGQPLSATITIIGRDASYSTAWTDPVNGDYCRMLPAGTYTVQVSAPGYPTRTFNNIVVNANTKTTLDVILGDQNITQTIPLNNGWNLISLRVALADLSVNNVFSGISGQLIQVKDMESVYSPTVQPHFNTLSQLTQGKAYWVKVNGNTNLTATALPINPATNSINLQAGWNLVAYYPANAMSPASALVSISPYLLEVRSDNQNYIPGNSGNTLSMMQSGKGYYIKVSQPCTLTYPSPSRN